VNAERAGPVVWVMHAGALGDWVLVWPLLRAMARSGARVVAATHHSKAQLAADRIDAAPGSIVALPGGLDQPRLSRWWSGPAAAGSIPRSSDWPVPPPGRLLNFLCDDSTPAGRNWIAASAAEFPRATIETIGPPGSASRAACWERERVAERGAVLARPNRDGPIVCHIGAGSEEKRWPLPRWTGLIERLRTEGHEVAVLAGEVERDRLTVDDRTLFDRLGGRILESLDQLAAVTAAARLFIGADTGPTHLAAQLGVATLALFGPTDPAVWSPVGPAVRTIAPGSPRSMNWLDVHPVLQAALEKPGA